MKSLPSYNGIRYGSAVIVVAVATVARLALDPVLGDLFPFATLFFAVLIVAGFGGRGPALLATALGGLVSTRFLLPPRDSFAVHGVENQAGLVLYLTVGLGIALLGGTLRESRRRAERDADEAVRQQEQLRITFASIGDAVLVTDAEGRVTSLNPVAETLTGWASAEAAGKPLPEVFRIVAEGTRQEVENPALRALREGVVVGLANHTVLVARDGSERPIDDSSAPIRDRSGRVVGAVLVFRDIGERRRAEAEVRRAGEQSRTILESITDAFCALDRDWRFLYVNRQAEALLGRSSRDLIGKSHWEEYPASLGTDIERHYRRAVAEGVAVTFEEYYPPHDRWYEIHAYPSGGGLSIYFRDATERRRAEEALRAAHRELESRVADRTAELSRANEFLRALLESIQDGIVACDAEGVLTLFNRATQEFHGLPPEPLPADRWAEHYDLYRADGSTRMPREEVPLFRALQGERVQGVEMVIAPRQGPVRTLLASGQAFRDERGRTLGAVVSMHDITGRKEAEEALRSARDELERRVERRTADLARVNDALQESDHRKGELLESLRASEALFRTMAESIPQLAWMARPDGHIDWYNRRWHDYTGTTPEEMQGWGWRSVHDPEVLPSVMERWSGSIASGEPFDMVFPLRGADGRFRRFLTRVMPVRGEGGQVIHWFGTNTDIEERQRIEEELRVAKDEAEQASRAKTQFLAVLSHELRTPLNPILLATSSMLERPAEPEQIRPTLEMIRQNVNLQARLIDDLLDVMRIVRSKMPLHWEVADVHRLIDQAIGICRSEFPGGEFRLDLDLAAARRHVNADAARLQQVFWNLIKNAVKFTPEGGAITLRTRNEPGPGGPDDRIVIEVVDTGIGIDPEILPRIFDPFQQGETTITREFGGLGLGLAICKGVVDAHGGTIAAESGGKGRGATFRVTLRALTEPAPGADGEPTGAGDEPADGRAGPSSLRILVVEDEPATLRLMARLLRGLGHAVTTAGAIGSAYEAFGAAEFDLIVSDIGLPDGTGLDLMRRVVALRGPTPSIALTGYGMEDDIIRSREAGFTAHMTKPIDFTKLETMIRRVVPPGA